MFPISRFSSNKLGYKLSFYRNFNFSDYLRIVRSWVSFFVYYIRDPFLRKKDTWLSLIYSSPPLLAGLVRLLYIHTLADEGPLDYHKKSSLNEKTLGLVRDGIVCIGQLPPAFCAQIVSAYHKQSERDLKGVRVLGKIGFDDKLFEQLISELPDLSRVSSEYYQGNCYFREEPHVHLSSPYAQLHNPCAGSVLHVDAFRQLTLMVILNDIDVNNVHLRYAKGSHLFIKPYRDRRLLDRRKILNSFEFFNGVGPAGTAFLFDAEGFHYGFYPNTSEGRFMIVCNFHPGEFPCKVNL